MRDIKTKETSTKPKVKNAAVRVPKELMRTAILEGKEKSREIANARENDREAQSPTEYATGRILKGQEQIIRQSGKVVYKAGEKGTHVVGEKIRSSAEKKERGNHAEGQGGQQAGLRERQQAYAKRTSDSRKMPVSEPSVEQARKSFKTQRQNELLNRKLTVKGSPKIAEGPVTVAGVKKEANIRQAVGRGKNQTVPNTQNLRVREKPQGNISPKTLQKQNLRKPDKPNKRVHTGIKKKSTFYRSSSVAQKRMAQKMAKETAMQSAYATQRIRSQTKKADMTVKGAVKAIEAAAKAVRSLFAAIGAAGGIALLLVVIIVGVIGGAAFSGGSQSNEAVSQEVLSYTSTITKYANQYGIPQFVPVIQAIMMQESGGSGTDPMQSSECPYNKKYSNSPNAIQDPDYSIEVGIQYYADCLREAGCNNPQDMEKLKLSLQGYNYGNGYITWAVRNYGGYSAENALLFSQQQAASHGWRAYGDPEYVPHVLRYYSASGGFLFAGLFGNKEIVSVALSQLGNAGGQKYWSWYGFNSRVAWCACFASWCADQSGLIQSGAVPKFSYCDDGIAWFKSHNKWQSGGYSPSPGSLIFFDWNGDGVSDHVGIVEKCEGGMVYTVEGNSSDAVNQRSYAISNGTIMGYGRIV